MIVTAVGLLVGLAAPPANASTNESRLATLRTPTSFDIVIVAGQSNAAGYGAGSSRLGETTECVYQYGRDEQLLPAAEPLDHLTRLDGRTGFAMEFARSWRAARPTSRCLLLVPAAADGTGFADGMWTPGGEAHESLIDRTTAALAQFPDSTVRALFWQQGENEAKLGWSTPEYVAAFSSMVASFQERIDGFDGETPLLIGEMVPAWVDASATRAGVHHAHAAIAEAEPNAHLVSSRLPTALTPNLDDPLHYSAESQLELGRRYFEVLHQLVPLTPTPTEPTLHPDAEACLVALFELADFTCVADGFGLIVVPHHGNQSDDVVVEHGPAPDIRVPLSHGGVQG